MKLSSTRKFALLAPTLIAATMLSAFCGQQKTQKVVYPGTEWARADPASKGYSAEKIEALTAFLKENTDNTNVMVAVGGEVIFTYGDMQRLSYTASVRKSILATLYGNYVENGTIDLKKTIGQLGMDDVGGLLPIEKEATVYDLITARSGVYHLASNPGDNSADAPARGSQYPGTYYLYNNWDFNAAGYVFEKLTGKDIYDALQDDIALKIGMQDWNREVQRKIGDSTCSIYPAYYIHLSTRDMARFGYLVLREGKWGDQQIVPAEWCRKMVSVVTPHEQMHPQSRRDGVYNYGYMWWSYDPKLMGDMFEGGYSANGFGGQYIAIIPKLDMVVAFKTIFKDGITPGNTGKKTPGDVYRQWLKMLADGQKAVK